MSFILDALKKLERERKQEPGVVMVGPVPWGERDRSHRKRWIALGGAALAVALVATALWLRSGPDPPAGKNGDERPSETATPAHGGEAAPAPLEPVGPPVPEAASAVRSGGTPSRPGTESTPPLPRSVDLPRTAAPPPAAATATQAGPGVVVETSTHAAGEEPLAAPGETEPEASVGGAEPEAFVGAAASEPLVEEAEPGAESPPVPEYRLTAISSRDGRPIALLNDRLVREGDRFGDILVVRIGESEVEIEVDGERRTIGF